VQYLLLIYGSDEEWAALDADEQRGIYARYGELERELNAAGAITGGAELRPAATATTVRVRNGETLVTDGPFAETREQLGGFFQVECGSMKEALEIARRIPTAEHGAVEVRPQHVRAEA